MKRYFETELNRVRRETPRRIAKGRVVTLSAAALVAVSLLLIVTFRTPSPNLSVPLTERAQSNVSAQPTAVQPDKNAEGATAGVERAKPSEGSAGDTAQSPGVVSTAGSNAPEFLVTDPAGYSRTLDDYRGHIFVIGVLKSGEADAASNLERLYRIFETNPKFRFLAVSNDRGLKPANTTFPIANNQGSKLLGTLPGDFVVLDESGTIQLRGSLVKDFDRLQRALQNK